MTATPIDFKPFLRSNAPTSAPLVVIVLQDDTFAAGQIEEESKHKVKFRGTWMPKKSIKSVELVNFRSPRERRVPVQQVQAELTRIRTRLEQLYNLAVIADAPQLAAEAKVLVRDVCAQIEGLNVV